MSTAKPFAPLDTHSPAWKRLAELGVRQRDISLSQRFQADPDRAGRYSLSAGPLVCDFSRCHLDDDILQALLALAAERRVVEQVQAMTAGEAVNTTEKRPAAHNRLRDADGADDVRAMFKRMRALTRAVRSGERTAANGLPFRHVVNIGIGGSDFGPRLVCDCLGFFLDADLDCHFVANVDPLSIERTLQRVDPARTLFIVSSKSFGTEETLSNARTARARLQEQLPRTDIGAHFVAVTSNAAKAAAFGIDETAIIPLPEWVGGRFSVWSAIGLPIALTFGEAAFDEFRAGGAAIDRHVREQAPEANLPLLLGLLDIWHNNFWGCRSLAVLPYDHSLQLLPTYLQQLFMESIGKAVDRDGQPLPVHSCPAVWGSEGTNAQHSFFQMLHQGTDIVPCDFILPLRSNTANAGQHRTLVANCLGQSLALAEGRAEADIRQQLLDEGLPTDEAGVLARHKAMPGNRPSTIIGFEHTSAETLGALIALYEYRMFTASAVWNINAFDQWGVELGKQVSRSVEAALAGGDAGGLDSAARQWVERYRAKGEKP